MRHSNNLCTAVMACKNSKMYIEESLMSFIEQDILDLDMVIVDDCSEDGSFEIAQDIIKKMNISDRVKIFKLARSSGCAVARNWGLAKARGKYIAIWDSDDVYMPDRISRTIHNMSVNHLDACGSWAFILKDFSMTECIYDYPPIDHDEIVWRLPSKTNPMIDPSCIIKKDCLIYMGGWSEDAKIALSPDLDLWFRMAKKGMRLGNIDIPLMRYRVRSNSNTGSKKAEMIKHHVEVVRRHYGKVELKRHESKYEDKRMV